MTRDPILYHVKSVPPIRHKPNLHLIAITVSAIRCFISYYSLLKLDSVIMLIFASGSGM